MTSHQSDSAVQQGAERAILDALAVELGVDLPSAGPLSLSGGVRIQLDAMTEDKTVAVEAYARQGKLKGGQLKKIAQDVLKLALLRREEPYADTRLIIVFASEEARSSITGWLKHAAEVFEVELHVVELHPGLRADIEAVQQKQKMVNVPLAEAADDLTIEE